ncbi:MAG TPA: cytochrome ubiquinol oxidase subunit I [Nitrospira sp.]|nr:cytochrome ubiquinol oxidase subunit I [Nitrospira sp.]
MSRDVYYRSSADSGLKVEGIVSGPAAPRLGNEDYPRLNVPLLQESRLVIWVLAQQHLYWGSFVLGVLMLVSMLEVMGLVLRTAWNTERYDALAHEMLAVLMSAISVTALVGVFLLITLLALYPDFTKYLFGVFRPLFLLYGLLAVGFSLAAYLYYYTWRAMSVGTAKWIHATLGVLANFVGTTIMLMANAWGSFMQAPAGVDAQGRFLGNSWHLLHTALWNPLNIHRLIGNFIVGAAVMMAYAAYRAMTAQSTEEKNHFDWIAVPMLLSLVLALFSTPASGYWLSREIYAYRQQMGITMFGGLLAWLGVVLVSLMAILFLTINYYLWQRIDALDHERRYVRYAKYVFFALALCSVPYITPHTFMMSGKELLAMGHQGHPVLERYGVESAKQAAINLMIVVTMWSFVLWRRCHVERALSDTTGAFVAGGFLAGIANLIWLGVYGNFIPANVRVGLQVPMVMTTLSLVILGIGHAMVSSAKKLQESRPARELAARGYIALIFIAFIVTWIMGLGGYRRSSLRLFWHITEIMPDNSPWAFTHTNGFAANVISLNALFFWVGVLLVLWITRIGTSRTV